MHHFLWLNDLVLPVREKNELLVDVAVVYFGFGYYVAKGYESMSKREGDLIQTTKLGYISEHQVQHIKGRIKKLY